MENKKLSFSLVALVMLGAFALMLGRFAPDAPEDANPPPLQATVTTHESAITDFQTERALETRLEEFFSLVEGAGNVHVLINTLQGRETVFAVDVNQSRNFSYEEDGQGGTRENRQYQSQEQTVFITDRQGIDIPLVLREIEPRVTGIVIIAQGGDCPFVRDALTRAARAVLGVEVHNIQVLPLRS